MLRPGGQIFAAAISRYAVVIDGFFEGLMADQEFATEMRRAVRDCQHRKPARRDGLFTTAYFHRVEELVEEMAEAGFSATEPLMIEGAWSSI